METIKETTVLYVEDDKKILKSFFDISESIFKKTHLAHNGKEGLDLYIKYKESIDVVITDLNMPIMDGIEMIKQIRDINFEIPIIITSAYNDHVTLNKVINLNVDGFINKPFSYKELLSSVNKVLKPIFYKKELEEKNILLYQQSKFAAMGEMIGNIAHQWRQPLNSIGATMMRLEFQTKNNDLSKKAVEDTIEKTNKILNHMSKTIDDFRNFFSPHKEKSIFKFKEIINDISELFMPQLTSDNISLEIICKKDIEIYGYPNELKQVLLNILSNSKDAIIASSKNNGKIDISIKQCTNDVIISISDNGDGIKQEILEKIFDPYFTTKFQAQGTGIGLYMSKLIIENNMQGTINVKNTKYGAKFTIKIPISLED
ncbi:MAG: hybrid sensor histidine kinase/response regulator [Campylobacterota bacterium]|nr:hybrid sensor histidine kinase/response regulator [Campylobacterota bacterium]